MDGLHAGKNGRLQNRPRREKALRAAEREERIAERKAEIQLKKEEKVAEKAQKEEAKAIKKAEREASKAKPAAKEEIKAPAPTIDEIVEKSEEEDRKRAEKEKAEVQTLDTRPRASIEKPEDEGEKKDDLEVAIFKGAEEEQAGEKELDKLNREQAKDVPVIKYKFPTVDLLNKPPNEGNEVDLNEIKENKRIILDKLSRHRIEIVGINAIVGPTVTLYELEPATDVKISKIESYSNDLKMATASKGLRMLTPIPGKSAVGIEVPNSTRDCLYQAGDKHEEVCRDRHDLTRSVW